jgi:hypothetical protein
MSEHAALHAERKRAKHERDRDRRQAREAKRDRVTISELGALEELIAHAPTDTPATRRGPSHGPGCNNARAGRGDTTGRGPTGRPAVAKPPATPGTPGPHLEATADALRRVAANGNGPHEQYEQQLDRTIGRMLGTAGAGVTEPAAATAATSGSGRHSRSARDDRFTARRQEIADQAREQATATIRSLGEVDAVGHALETLREPRASRWSTDREEIEGLIAERQLRQLARKAGRTLWAAAGSTASAERRGRGGRGTGRVCVALAILEQAPGSATSCGQQLTNPPRIHTSAAQLFSANA